MQDYTGYADGEFPFEEELRETEEELELELDGDPVESLSDVSDQDFLQYAGLADHEVVALAGQGDGRALEYLLDKYKNFVRAKARYYFLAGADKEDLIQEGMIGLYKAIRDFQEDKQASFRAFAELCITRQVITAVKSATRQKHKPLNGYVSLNRPIFDEESDRTLIDFIKSSKVLNPEEIVISKEDVEAIEKNLISTLSSLEKQVLNLYLSGKSYQAIAPVLNRPVKSIDNALQRVKAKLEKHLNAEKNKQ